MNRIIVTSKVGADGVLHVTVPVGAAEAHREVQVTIEPTAGMRPRPMTQEEWQRFVLTTAGSISDPGFMRQEQGTYEQRQGLP